MRVSLAGPEAILPPDDLVPTGEGGGGYTLSKTKSSNQKRQVKASNHHATNNDAANNVFDTFRVHFSS